MTVPMRPAAGSRSPSGAGVQRAVVAPRSAAEGSVNAPGAPAARVAGPPRPGVATRPPGSAPIAPASPRGAAALGREMLGEDWYVGVGGVPLGPVPVTVIRDKALAGLIDGESLVWRDGFEQWKPLKNFPELLEVIATAEALRSPSATSSKPGRSADPPVWSPRAEPPVNRPGSQDPIPVSPVRPVRASSPVISPMSSAAAPSASASPHPAVSPRFSAPRAAERPTSGTAASYTAVSPVLPSPAERPPSGPQIPIDVLADPFTSTAPKPVPSDAPKANIPQSSGASLPTADVTVGLPAVTKSTSELDLDEPVRVKRSHGLPALAYAFIAMAAAFGGVAAWVLLSKPQQITYVPSPPQPTPVVSVAPSGGPLAPTAEVEVGVPTTDSTGPVVRTGPGPVGSIATRPKATPSGTAAPFDTTGFISTVPGPSPNGPSTAQSGSGTLSPGEIQGVIAQNQPLIKRKCWQPALDARTPGAPANARVTVNVVIGPSGNVESASAGGGESFPGLASCIASRVKGWKFSPSSSSTPANIPFVFAGQ